MDKLSWASWAHDVTAVGRENQEDIATSEKALDSPLPGDGELNGIN